MSLTVNVVRDLLEDTADYEDAVRHAIADIKDHEAHSSGDLTPSRLIVRNETGRPLYKVSLRLNANSARMRGTRY